MEKRSLMFVLLLILFCSGCTVQYNLDIDHYDRINEQVILKSSTSADTVAIRDYVSYLPINKDADDSSIFNQKLDGVVYYDQKKSALNDAITFQHLHSFNTFQNDYITSGSYKYVTVSQRKNNLILSTSKVNQAFERYDNLDEIVVKIHSRYKLVDTNADNSNNYTYIWRIDRNNYHDKFLYLSLDLTDRKKSLYEMIQNFGIFTYFPIILILLGIGLFIYLFIKRSKKRDQI